MNIVSIQVGMPRTVTFRGQTVSTGIFKSAVPGPVQLGFFNLAGDCQADLTVHGGRDKALYGYGLDAYPRWRVLRPSDTFEPGSFGENLCFEQLDEASVAVGDVFTLGHAVIQATQPRLPCYKLGVKFSDPHIVKQFLHVGRPGVYFRVLEEGAIDVGDHLRLSAREPIVVSVQELFDLAHSDGDEGRLCQILQVTALPDYWREKISKKLALKRPPQ